MPERGVLENAVKLVSEFWVSPGTSELLEGHVMSGAVHAALGIAASVQLKDINSWAMKRSCHHIAVEDLVPLIPVNTYRPVKVQEHTYGCFTLAVRIPGLGEVRISVSFETGRRTGRSVCR